jgi:hypothetical protein
MRGAATSADQLRVLGLMGAVEQAQEGGPGDQHPSSDHSDW